MNRRLLTLGFLVSYLSRNLVTAKGTASERSGVEAHSDAEMSSSLAPKKETKSEEVESADNNEEKEDKKVKYKKTKTSYVCAKCYGLDNVSITPTTECGKSACGPCDIGNKKPKECKIAPPVPKNTPCSCLDEERRLIPTNKYDPSKVKNASAGSALIDAAN